MKIKSVSAQPDRVGRHTVGLSDGSVMRLYRQTIADFGLYPGMELSEEDVLSLQTAAGFMSAKMRAVRIVAASSVSKRDLEQRLVQKGEDPSQAKEAVQWMADMELVDDCKTAEIIVHRCISKGYGIARAKQVLYEKRIPKEYWDAVLEDYPDQLDVIVSFLRSKLGNSSDPKDIRKAMDALIRKGHTYSMIRRGMQQLSMDADDFPEE